MARFGFLVQCLMLIWGLVPFTRSQGHKKAIPQPAPLESRLFATQNEDDEPILTSTSPTSPNSRLVDPAPKNPWDYIFKAPVSHQPPPASIRAIPRSRLANKISPAARLAKARERSFDHRAGFPVLGGGMMNRVTVQVPAGEEGEGEDDGEEAGRMGDMRNW